MRKRQTLKILHKNNKQTKTLKTNENVYDHKLQLSQKPTTSRGRETRDTDKLFRFCIKQTKTQKQTKMCMPINYNCHRNQSYRDEVSKEHRQINKLKYSKEHN